MSEKQETMWVVMRQSERCGVVPVKVFDDRKDARSYVKKMAERARGSVYYYVSVKRG